MAGCVQPLERTKHKAVAGQFVSLSLRQRFDRAQHRPDLGVHARVSGQQRPYFLSHRRVERVDVLDYFVEQPDPNGLITGNRCATGGQPEGGASMTKALALELASEGIRVNTVAPTFVQTELTARSLADPEFRAWVLGEIPLRRLGTVDEVAAAVAYLASPASSLTTGSSLLVDGGWTAH